MSVVYKKSSLLSDAHTTYCGGCGHGIAHNLVAESLEELGVGDRAICISSIGCSAFIDRFLKLDTIQPPHGRSPAAATAVKRVHPDNIVFTYQGDGDLAGIGNGEINHAVARGEKLTTIFINNGVFGMTGGQMAPTTLEGVRTTTSVHGRDSKLNGYPMHVSELLANHTGAYYIERVSLDSYKNVVKAKAAIKKAFRNQMEGHGYNLVEVLAICPTGWKMNCRQCFDWVRSDMMREFPLGVYKDKGARP